MAWSVVVGPAPVAVSFLWEPPTQNVDGSPITPGQITGYEVGLRQGGSPGTYPIILEIDGPFTAADLVANVQPPLPSGLYIGNVRSIGPINSAWGLEFSFAV